MIRFGVIVTVVVAAVGLLVVGAVAGDLTLVYVSIALAAVALLLLVVGVAVWRDEVFASSVRRDERDLVGARAVGQAGRSAAGYGAAEGWPERPAPTLRPGPTPGGAGPGQPGGDTREFPVSVGALPDRDAPADRDRRSGEPRPGEQPRAGDPAGRAGRDVRHRERHGREAGTADWPGRDPAAQDFASREAAAAGWPGRGAAGPDGPGRDAGAPDRPGRDAAPGEQSPREAAAADWAARETLSAPRSDRAARYPIAAETERYEAADDPTRLAHRLDSLADFGRPADPDATGSARSRAGRAGSPWQPAPAPIDPLTGPAGERRPTAEPVAAAPPTGRPAARPAGIEQGSTADADAPQSARAVPPIPAPSTPMPAEAASTLAAGPVFPASPARAPASRDDDTATAARGAAASPAPPAPAPAAPAAPADRVGTAATSESAAPASTASAESATIVTGDGAAAAPAIGLDDQVSVVPGIARYHKSDCILIRFLSEDDLEVMSRRAAEAAGSAPCRACRPDRPAASD
jgi:hypothetical protein